jgi:hypothetical protein
VRDPNKQQLAYVYYENEPGRRSAAKFLTKDETRRIAANVAKLPERDTPATHPIVGDELRDLRRLQREQDQHICSEFLTVSLIHCARRYSSIR